LLVLDQLTEAVGNVQTHSASREEYESDQPDHWTHEFFGTDSAGMLKHADDGEGQERPQNNAQDSRNYKDDFPDHEGPPDGRRRTASGLDIRVCREVSRNRRSEPYLFDVTGFFGDGIDLAELPSDGIDPPLSISIPPLSDGAGSVAAAWNAWSFVRPVLLA